jgi:trimethylamine---corrinoid protein Co-methyltransferase
MGLLESCTVLYPEELVLAADIYHRVRITAGRLDTSRAAMALDVIKEIGPRGQFLRHRHTRDHMHHLEFSELATQADPSGNFRDPIQIAREKVDWILQNHYPKPLEEEQKKEFKHILEAAEKKFGTL